MRKALFIFILLSLSANLCHAWDWRALHNQADTTNLDGALRIVKQSPDSPANLYLLALVYLNLHQDNKAKGLFVKILGITKGIPEAKWGIAEVMRRQHKLEESEKLLKEIISANPQFSPAYISLAYIKYIHFDFKDCIRLACKVIDQGKEKLDLSNYVRAYLLVAGAKGMLAHYGGLLSKMLYGTTVLATLKKAQSLSPNAPAVLLGLGSFYLLAPKLAGGDVRKAKDYLERAVKADPLFADAYVRLAQVYRLKGDSKKYELYLKKALEIDPQNEIALDIINNRCRFVCVTQN